ncbi:MAG TPA: LysM peptidoglycan-binding domain-containing protein, partial [Ktedonobacteraceae bacterium]
IRQFVQETSILRKIGKTSRAVKPKIYIVKKGDTLGKIAAKKSIYGDASKWKWIADANHLRDRRSIYVGKRLIIPIYK